MLFQHIKVLSSGFMQRTRQFMTEAIFTFLCDQWKYNFTGSLLLKYFCDSNDLAGSNRCSICLRSNIYGVFFSPVHQSTNGIPGNRFYTEKNLGFLYITSLPQYLYGMHSIWQNSPWNSAALLSSPSRTCAWKSMSQWTGLKWIKGVSEEVKTCSTFAAPTLLY